MIGLYVELCDVSRRLIPDDARAPITQKVHHEVMNEHAHVPAVLPTDHYLTQTMSTSEDAHLRTPNLCKDRVVLVTVEATGICFVIAQGFTNNGARI